MLARRSDLNICNNATVTTMTNDSNDIDDDALVLYSRQMLLPNVGIAGQLQLQNSCVLIVGAGGLGSTVAQYLAGSGVGRLIIVDDDVVELSNLPRQVLFSSADVGQYKAKILCQRLQQRLPSTSTMAYVRRFSLTLMQEIVADYSPNVVIDAGDNLLLSQQLDVATDEHRLPLVHASVSRFEGYVYVCLPTLAYPRLQALFPEQSEQETCSQTGVLTVAVGMVGACQAAQAVRVLLPQTGRISPELLVFDGATMRWSAVAVGD